MSAALLIAVGVYYLAGQGVRVLAIAAVDKSTSDSDNDISHRRTTWNIVWSCAATIFACIWVALHPNIPGPDESTLKITLRRVKLMAMALIAPELVVVWAMRQWLVSRTLAEKYRGMHFFPIRTFVDSKIFLDHGWVQAHGYFAVMGGFMLYDGDKATRTLAPHQEKSQGTYVT
jgi:hypothetical protein